MTIEEIQAMRASSAERSFDDPYYDTENIAARAAEAEAVAESLTELVAWLESQTWSEFAVSLAQQFHRKGSLSERQVASARSMMAKCQAREAQRTAAKAAPAPDTGIDLTDLPSGYYGVPGGDTRLKVRVNHVTRGNWEGTTFVDDGAAYGERTNYGRQAPGGSYQGKIQEQLRAILADPQAAMVEYGKLTGRCGICNRQLEDEQSVARGIGPVCAQGLGW